MRQACHITLRVTDARCQASPTATLLLEEQAPEQYDLQAGTKQIKDNGVGMLENEPSGSR